MRKNVAELIGTFILFFCGICAMVIDNKQARPDLQGASMPPVRSIAPAIVSGHLEHLWLYLVAPVSGAALAIPIWKYLAVERVP